MLYIQTHRTKRFGTPRHLLLLAIFSFMGGMAFSQTRTAQGTVRDDQAQPLPGAVVMVEGTNRGTLTDINGTFRLETNTGDQQLRFSFIGYQDQMLPLDGRTQFDVTLGGMIGIDEVVITALGVERSEKSLGYAIQSLDGKAVSEVPVTNAVSALNGKIAGVNIQSSAAGPTASANVTIRGASSLTGNNQALFVVNGIPITNGLFSSGDGLNGSTTIDFGNAAQIINPDDIAEISVLKGPAAAALYGTRAAAGVVLINTKTGQGAPGWHVDLNSSTTISGLLRMPDFQNEYGVGGYGRYSYFNGSTYTGDYYDAFGENWGPRMDGTPIKQWNTNGEATPFTAAPDNIRNFFRTGVTGRNHIAVSNQSEDGDFRMGYTNLNSRGIVPNTDVQRHTISMSSGQDIGDRLNIRTNLNYIRSGSDNVPNAGYDESSSIMYNWLWYQRNAPINDLQDYWKPGLENVQQANVEELWTNNPWFLVNENTNAFDNDRIIGNMAATFDLTDRVSLRYRFGADVNNEKRRFRRAMSTKSVLLGSYREDDLRFNETNNELLLSFDGTDYEKDWNLSARVGGNIMRQSTEILRANAPQLLIPGIYNLGNARSGVITDDFSYRKGINSTFGMANLSFKNRLFLDLTGRNDWSSTLPSDNNSYFYPSATASAILSDWFDLGKGLDFAKVRAAYAEVGGDTDPYNIRNVYVYENAWGDQPVAAESANLANAALLPERTSSIEFGTDLRWWMGRLSLDIAWYQLNSRDQIINLPLASTSGYTSRIVNSGEIKNSGIEVVLRGQPIKNEALTWTSTLNLTRNRSEVVSLAGGVDSYQIIPDLFPNDGGQDLSFEARVGQPYGLLVGLGFQRDDAGNIIHENGLPMLTENKINAGTYQPDMLFGWDNEFRFGRITAGFLINGQLGGQVFSRSHALYATAGSITNDSDPNMALSTLEGRETYDISYGPDGTPVYTAVNEGGWGVVGPGMMYDADGALVENDVVVPTRDYILSYYGNGFSRDNIESALYDATFVKLKELRIGFDVPGEWLSSNLSASSATVSLVGRNLLLFTNVPTIDPETYSIRAGRIVPGFESTSLPTPRTIGLAINLHF